MIRTCASPGCENTLGRTNTRGICRCCAMRADGYLCDCLACKEKRKGTANMPGTYIVMVPYASVNSTAAALAPVRLPAPPWGME